MTLLERAVRPTAGATCRGASPAARAALEPRLPAACAKSKHIERWLRADPDRRIATLRRSAGLAA